VAYIHEAGWWQSAASARFYESGLKLPLLADRAPAKMPILHPKKL
jgi:hypothetical protein